MVRGEWDRTQKPPRPKEAPTFVRSLGDAHRLPDEVVIPPPAPPAHAAAAEAAALACGEGGGGRGGGSGQAEPPLGDILLPSGTPPQHSPAPLGCIGLVIRGLMGVKPATVKLVTSRGCKKGEKKGAGGLGGGAAARPKAAGGVPPARSHLGTASQDKVSGLADKHAAILHQLLAVQEGKATEEVPDLPLAALGRSKGGRGEVQRGDRTLAQHQEGPSVPEAARKAPSKPSKPSKPKTGELMAPPTPQLIPSGAHR